MTTLKVYKAYNFRTKDPAIDTLRTLIEDHYGGKHLKPHMLREIAVAGGPTEGCMRAWFYGKTQRPQNPTLEAAGRALGYERVWKKMSSK